MDCKPKKCPVLKLLEKQTITWKSMLIRGYIRKFLISTEQQNIIFLTVIMEEVFEHIARFCLLSKQCHDNHDADTIWSDIKSEFRLPSRDIIMVHGFFRRIQKYEKHDTKWMLTSITPELVVQICCKYCLNATKFYLYQPRFCLDEFDVSRLGRASIMDTSNISNMSDHEIKKFIVMPELTAWDVRGLTKHDTLPSRDIDAPYFGIFSRTTSKNLFILKYQGKENISLSRWHKSWVRSFTSEIQIDNILDYIYCGNKHGIIASRFDGFYQLKLDEIGLNYKKEPFYWFRKLCHVPEYLPRFGYSRMCYMLNV